MGVSMEQAGRVAERGLSGSVTPTFEEYVVASRRRLWQRAWMLAGDTDRAEDLVQTTLVRCWSRWDRIVEADHLDAYVRTVMLRLYLDDRRRRWSSEIPSVFRDDVLTEPDPAGRTEQRRDLVTALDTLPVRQRAVVVLRYFEDLTEVQTATALGISVGTVKSQTSRALRTLRDCPGLEEQR